MAIIPYTNSNGETFFMVRARRRSRKDRSIRVCKEKRGLRTIEEAKKEEKRLGRLAQDRISEFEFEGATLLRLVNRWYEFNLNRRVKLEEIELKTLNDDKSALNKWLRPFMFRPAVELSAFVLQDVFRTMKEQGVSHRQQVRLKRMVKSLYDFGRYHGYLPKHSSPPTSEVFLKADAEKEPEILATQDIQKLLSVAMEENHPWRHIWAFALLTGMRSGELYALSWADVDLDNRLLRVSRSFQSATKVMKSTKAGYWRDVPINEQLMRVIEDLRPLTRESGFVLPRMWEWEKGEQARILKGFCIAHGLSPIKFHTLRACFATQLLRKGVEPAKLMKVAGWKDLSTMQRYIRLAGIEVQGVTDSLDVLPPLDFDRKVVSINGF